MSRRRKLGDIASPTEIESALAKLEAVLERFHARLVEENRAQRAEQAETVHHA